MTVTYSLNVANTRLAGFAKLLVRWRGSIYKLLYREMLIFCICYYGLSIIYRYGLKDKDRRVFEKVALYCEAFTKLIPLSFVLGFYVSIVVNRWWKQYSAIPWPDDLLLMIAGYIHGTDERGRMIRRTLARYLLLLQSLCFQAISTSVRKRFPTLNHLVEAGLMMKEEKVAYDEIPGTHGKWWLPATWFTNLTVRARREGRIKDDHLMKQILTEALRFRSMAGDLFAYDWISIPLVYTQTVTIAVYTYFCATLMARQYLDPAQGYSGYDIDLYVPIFTILEFFFFMGWLKVAEQLINPFGEDDDDFELNWILDRNLVVSMIIVDSMYNKFPRLQKDSYWDESSPTLPYTKSSMGLRNQPYLGSAINLDINPEESEFVPPSLETIMEDEVDDDDDVDDDTLIMGTYITPPNSPAAALNDLFSLSGDQESLRRPPSSISQSALNMLPDFISSRIANMILGSSSENVSNGGTLKPTSSSTLATSPTNAGAANLLEQNNPFADRKNNSLNASFSLKSPRRRTRKVSTNNSFHSKSANSANDFFKGSISSSLFSRDSTEDVNNPNYNNNSNPVNPNVNNTSNNVNNVNRISPNYARRSLLFNRPRASHSLSAQDCDQRSLVIDLGDGASLQSQSTLSSIGQQSRTRPTSVSMDESTYQFVHGSINNNINHLSTNPNNNSNRFNRVKGSEEAHHHLDGTTSLVYESDFIDDLDPKIGQFEPSSMLPPISPSSASEPIITMPDLNTHHQQPSQPPPPLTKQQDEPKNGAENEEEGEEAKENTSSQESLSPGSNQSTVTSITQLINKSNGE